MVTGSWEFEFNSISFISVFSNHVFFTGLLFKCLLKCLKYLQNIKRLGKKFKCIKAGPSEYELRCTDCNSIFSIKNGGHSDVTRHCSGIKHSKNCGECSDNSKNISDNSININEENYENNNQIELTPEEQVMKAETLQALKVVSSNYSFASTTDDAERFGLMFPDLPTAVKYQQSRTKVNYVIKHGISPYIKALYINDFSGTPSKLLGLY